MNLCMIETVAHERFYKDVAHEPLRPALPKVPAHRHTSPPPDVAPSHATRSSGASFSSTNSDFLKKVQGIFAMCRRTDQCMDVLDHRIDILHRNQEIIHSQRDEPLIDFPEEPVYPPIPDPYASLTQAKLAAFGVDVSHAPPASSDNDDEEAANDDEETEDDE
jgi:hypothetical protein